jgi:hypothetical protein
VKKPHTFSARDLVAHEDLSMTFEGLVKASNIDISKAQIRLIVTSDNIALPAFETP